MPGAGSSPDRDACARGGNAGFGSHARPAPAAARKGVLGTVRQTGVLRVGMEPDAPPLHFINDRKQEDGFDFRLAGIVAEVVGAKRVQVVEADYEDLPDKLRAGEIDIIMAGYVPDPSIEGVIWSNGYLDFGLCMIVNESMASHVPLAGRPGRQTHRHLRRSGGRALGEGEHPQRAGSASSRATTAGSRRSRSDQADALIYDYPFAAEEIKEHPRTIIVKYNLNQSKYAVGIPEGNFDLIFEVNNADRQVQGDAAVRRADARLPVERVRAVHEAGAGAPHLHREGGRHAEPRSPPPS